MPKERFRFGFQQRGDPDEGPAVDYGDLFTDVGGGSDIREDWNDAQQVVMPDGKIQTRVPVRDYGKPIRDPNGNVVGFETIRWKVVDEADVRGNATAAGNLALRGQELEESKRQFDVGQKSKGIESSLDRDLRLASERRMIEDMLADSRQKMLDLKAQLAGRSLAPGQAYARGWEPGGVMASLYKGYGLNFTPLGQEQTIPVDTAEAYNANQAAANPLLADIGARESAERERRAGLGG